MLSRYDVIPATREAILSLAANLRDEDVNEIKSYDEDVDATEAFIRNFENSTHCWVGTIDGVPACAFGVYEPYYFSSTACPWFRGSTKLRGHSVGVLRKSKEVLSWLSAHYSLLTNVVDASNTKAIQWLEWLGFSVDEMLTYLPGSDTAYRRYRIRSVK